MNFLLRCKLCRAKNVGESSYLGEKPLIQWETEEKNYGYKKLEGRNLLTEKKKLGEENCELDKETGEITPNLERDKSRKSVEEMRNRCLLGEVNSEL